MIELIQHFIDGKFTEGQGKGRGDVFNPSTGQKAREVVFGEKADLDAAVASAKEAQVKWAKVTPLRRARVLFKFNELLGKHLDELAKLLSEEHGKTFDDARGEVIRGKEVVEFACGAPQLLKGEYSENVGTDVDCYMVHQPLGVCAGITPFNFPPMISMWMFPIATVCGNTFILKPSEKDPSVVNRLAELFMEAGAPPGVLNVVHGDKTVVNEILEHPDIAAVSFVGQTPVAKYIYETAAKYGKRVQALGGAKNHCVVMPDADIEEAANALMGAAYGSAGERCMAISVGVAVGDEVGDQLVAKMSEKIKSLKVLPSLAEGAEMGPLVTKEHLERVTSYIGIGEKEGATLVADGRGHQVEGGGDGFFLGASLFDHVKPEMKIYQDEIFGPVFCIVRVPDFDAAVELINNNPFGNGTSIFTKSGAAARNYAHRIQVGLVGINIPIPVPMAFHCFGGWKNSLFGDTHTHGTEGFHFYTKMKTITTRWPAGQIIGADYKIPLM